MRLVGGPLDDKEAPDDVRAARIVYPEGLSCSNPECIALHVTSHEYAIPTGRWLTSYTSMNWPRDDE